MATINTKPDAITPAKLDCIVMPNGEVISCGKSLGYLKDFEGMLTTKD